MYSCLSLILIKLIKKEEKLIRKFKFCFRAFFKQKICELHRLNRLEFYAHGRATFTFKFHVS